MSDYSCIACGGREAAPLYRGLLRCRACGHASADPGLSDEELARLYDHSFFREGAFHDYEADRRYHGKNFALRQRVLRRFLDPRRHRRLLEIGSAYGFYLDSVRGEFEEVLGIDVTDEGVRHTRETLGLPAVQGDFLRHDFGGRKFDVVCMWDTVEHVRRPDLYVERIAELTEPGALLALTTGDMGSAVARLRGARWRMIIPPVHLHYFSRETIARLLAARGFDVIYDRHCGFYRSASTAAYIILALRHDRPALFRRLSRAGLLDWGFYLNLYDIMYVIARRR